MMTTTLVNARMLVCGAMLVAAFPLAGCSSPPPVTHTTTTTTEESNAPMPPAPMQAPLPPAPGTVTTQTTHTQTVQ